MIHMAGPGWLRVAIGGLFVVMVLLAVGLGWVKPNLVLYVVTSVVGVLAWLDYEFNHRERPPQDRADATETTAPDVYKGGGPGRA